MLKVYSTADGSTSVRYTVAGELAGGEELFAPITDVASLRNAPTILRLDLVFFSFDKGMRASLRWEDAESSLIAPLEDRGFFSFESYFGGWSNPQREGATGNICVKVLAGEEDRVWSFALKLELTKQSRKGN